MPVFKVRVKWGKQKFDAVELNTDEPPAVFKMQLFSLSGVPPDRQKVMVAGVTVLDEDWGKAKAKIKENVMLLMMGSAEELPQAPSERPKFIEDMSDAEAAAALSLPTGLENFGNTCYMNATLQCFKVVPELRDALQSYQPPFVATSGSPQSTVTALKILYEEMDHDRARLPLALFLQSLHAAVPQFAQRDEKTGHFKQQDAHECWATLSSHLTQTLDTPPSSSSSSSSSEDASAQLKFMEQYFGVQLQSVYRCLESADEMEMTETENNYQVSCFIAQDIKYMHTGLLKGLEGTIEKHSPSLGRDAQYKKVSRVARLPAYLTVQFVRFFVGKAPNSDEFVSKKILKDIKFTMRLDMFEFCTAQLQEQLLPTRARFKQVEEKKMALKAQAIAEGKIIGKQQQTVSSEVPDYEPFDRPDDPGCNNSGYYELLAVLTHQGRSSSSGHYVGWVRHREDNWLKLDDDKVSMVKEEDILKLSGGGDWHIAYILLYGPRKLEKSKEEVTAS